MGLLIYISKEPRAGYTCTTNSSPILTCHDKLLAKRNGLLDCLVIDLISTTACCLQVATRRQVVHRDYYDSSYVNWSRLKIWVLLENEFLNIYRIVVA
jgi:hypothetical protein